MKTLCLIFTVAIWTVACFCGGYFYFQYNEPENIKIVTETETKFKYIKVAATPREIEECYRKSLALIAKVRNKYWIDITASDGCKVATKSIKIRTYEQYRNTVFISKGIDSKQLFYFRKFGRVSIGGGVGLYSPVNTFDISIGAGFSF